jgi:hypothetical protein
LNEDGAIVRALLAMGDGGLVSGAVVPSLRILTDIVVSLLMWVKSAAGKHSEHGYDTHIFLILNT